MANTQIQEILDDLEQEAISIIREAFFELKKLAILFSGGKDSITLFHLIKKAIWPRKIDFSLLHIDTGFNFPEVENFLTEFSNKHQVKIIRRSVKDTVLAGLAKDEPGYNSSRNKIQGVTLMQAIQELKLDGCFGGARRDEEKARAKERIFSLRDRHGHWDPDVQRPEPWLIFNLLKRPEEHFRIFPLSNWSELDIWYYIQRENIELPSLYFAHEREVFESNGIWLAYNSKHCLANTERYTKTVRFRTLGDMPSTGASFSEAQNLEAIIEELTNTSTTERASRADDKGSEASLELRKKGGYF